MTFATTDLSDEHPHHTEVVRPGLRHFGGRQRFCGPARTVRCYEDNTLVRAALEQPGDGAVLVVDGAGSDRCALIGGDLAELAHRNGWSGVIVWGSARDAIELEIADVGVMALHLTPRRSIKQGQGLADADIEIGGVPVSPGAWVYADRDGVIVAPHDLLAP